MRVHISHTAELTNTAPADTHRYAAPRLLSYELLVSVLLGATWCVYFVVLCLSEDRTGRDKGSSVSVFTANTANVNSRRRRKGRRLMAGVK